MYGCLIDIDARSVKVDRPVRQMRRPAGNGGRMQVVGSAYDLIESIAAKHGFQKFKGGLYLSETATREDAVRLIDALTEQCSWFARAATQAHILEFTNHENMIDRVRDHLK